MIDWLVEEWDWMIYRLAHRSLERMCRRNVGFAYLFALWLEEWRKENPMPPELERSTEWFFESLKTQVKTNEDA